MANQKNKKVLQFRCPFPPVILIPVIDESSNCQKRIKEVHDLVAQIVGLAKKKGRPSTKEEDIQNAA